MPDRSSSDPERAGRNPFSSPGFSRWLLASIVAGTGVGIQAVTVPLFIRDRVPLDLRSVAIAGALISSTLPGACLVLFGGALADRVERRWILARTYSVAAVVSVFYVVLAGLDVRIIWPVFPLAAVVGAAGAFTNPARQSMLPQLVTSSQLQNGVILGTMGFMSTMQFIGPSLGGVLVDLQGFTVAFGAEVLLLAIAALVFSGLRTPLPSPTGRHILGDLADGLRYIRREPALLGLLLLGTIPGVFFIGPFSVTVPIVVPDIFAASDKWVGLLWGCFGAGVVLGSILLSLRPVPRRGTAVCFSTLFGGAVLIGVGLSETLWITATLLAVWGLSASIFMNFVVALLQEHADPKMMGRTMSMYSLVFFASMPIGYAQAGLLARAFGPATTLLSSGIAAAAIGLGCLLLLKPVRALA